MTIAGVLTEIRNVHFLDTRPLPLCQPAPVSSIQGIQAYQDV
jgi:hypothetical protein